jgi:hypothetical protein
VWRPVRARLVRWCGAGGVVAMAVPKAMAPVWAAAAAAVTAMAAAAVIVGSKAGGEVALAVPKAMAPVWAATAAAVAAPAAAAAATAVQPAPYFLAVGPAERWRC